MRYAVQWLGWQVYDAYSAFLCLTLGHIWNEHKDFRGARRSCLRCEKAEKLT